MAELFAYKIITKEPPPRRWFFLKLNEVKLRLSLGGLWGTWGLLEIRVDLLPLWVFFGGDSEERWGVLGDIWGRFVARLWQESLIVNCPRSYLLLLLQ